MIIRFITGGQRYRFLDSLDTGLFISSISALVIQTWGFCVNISCNLSSAFMDFKKLMRYWHATGSTTRENSLVPSMRQNIKEVWHPSCHTMKRFNWRCRSLTLLIGRDREGWRICAWWFRGDKRRQGWRRRGWVIELRR